MPSFISANRISIEQDFIDDKGGILNALTFASAQYVFKVLEKHGKEHVKRFQLDRKLKRTIIHKNAHLDEYFAELIFRAILPPYLKDVEVLEHVLISKEDDFFAKLSWANGVVFGIGAVDAGGAKALAFYDEHNADGTRVKPSCSQLVAEEYLGNNIPSSIQNVLNEVNYIDSNPGAHQYNIKHSISAMHDILFVVGSDEVNGGFITKNLTENWKRAVIGACLAAVIYSNENNLLTDELDESAKEKIERSTKRSLDYFLEKSILGSYSPLHFNYVKNDVLRMFKVWRADQSNDKNWHKTVDGAIWKDRDGNKIKNQTLILQRICFSLSKCWGENIANFIMMHLWEILFQQQLSFQEAMQEIIQVTETGEKGATSFGYIEKIVLTDIQFEPEQKLNDRRKRVIDSRSPLWIYEATITNPRYPNVKAVLGKIINDDYSKHGNAGFGVSIIHDKTINSKAINNGPTLPYRIWKQLSDKIHDSEPDRWFQLKNAEGEEADFILNRTKSHQEFLPSDIVNIDFVKNIIVGLA